MLLGNRELPPRIGGMIELLAPVMLAALVVSNTFGGDHKLVLDARAAGLAAAAIPIALRAPLLVTVVVAAATAAIIRAIRSEEHTSELQSHVNIVCRLLLEKKITTEFAF